MPNFNKVILMGNLTRDPELKYTANKTAVCNVGLATNRAYTDQEGNVQEETTFVDLEAWGQLAETISKHLSKGRPVFIEGRLRQDRWQDNDGNNRSRMKVVVESFQFLDPPKNNSGN